MAISTPPAPTAPGFSVPSTWLMLIGTFLIGGDFAADAAQAGFSPALTATLVSFGGFLIGLGAFLTQHGH
jgi:hypothetical protein